MLRSTGRFVTDLPTAPYPPPPAEAKNFYYGIPSSPRLVAGSSIYDWTNLVFLGSDLITNELRPLGIHELHAVWEDEIGPAMIAYLDAYGVQWSSLDPLRVGHVGQPCAPAIIWLGVAPDSLTVEDGIKVAIHLRGILSDHGIDMHVEIRETEIRRSVKPLKPVVNSDPTVAVREPFSTPVGLPICAASTPTIGGTRGFYMTDSKQPGKIFLVTSRHVVFRVDEEKNEVYRYSHDRRRRNILLCSNPTFEKHITLIKKEIQDSQDSIKYYNGRLELASRMSEEIAESERTEVMPLLEHAEKGIPVLENFLAEVSKDWAQEQDRVIGHVVLSPPIGFNVGQEGFTEDWALIELDQSKFDSTNFVGNTIDLSTTVPWLTFIRWMGPHLNPPYSFEYPDDRLLRFCGFIPDQEMYKPTSTNDQDNDPVIMVLKRGQASGLTVGRLNTIRSFVRYPFEPGTGKMSKEIAVLSRDSESGAFSELGDSGSSVIDGQGRFAGLLTAGSGRSDDYESDITYVTSANFLRERIASHGFQPNFFPEPLFNPHFPPFMLY